MKNETLVLEGRPALLKKVERLEEELRVLRDYSQVLAATLMRERRYGPPIGAPGTEGVNEWHLHKRRRLLAYPTKDSE